MNTQNNNNITLVDLRIKKNELLEKVSILSKAHKKKYSKMDITSAKSNEEKESESIISNLFSEINSLVSEIRTFQK